MLSINAVMLLAVLAVGQGEDVERDRISITNWRPKVIEELKFKNGYVRANGCMEGTERNRIYSIAVWRIMRRVHPNAPALKQTIDPESLIQDLEIGTVIPIGNYLVRLTGGGTSGVDGMIERSTEYDVLSKGLGDGIIAYNTGSLRFGEHDRLAVEEIETDLDEKVSSFSGRIFHREGEFGMIVEDRTVVVKKAKPGDVIQIADLKLRVLNVVPPDKALRITGWVAFELP